MVHKDEDRFSPRSSWLWPLRWGCGKDHTAHSECGPMQVEEGRARRQSETKMFNSSLDSSHCKSVVAAHHPEDCERAFEIADTLEQGLACEVVSDFMHPLRRSSKLWRFNMTRSEDRLKYYLQTEEGFFLMYAQAFPEARKIQFHLYNPDDKDTCSLFDSSRPAFTMTWNESRTEWRILQEKCEKCQFSPRHLSCVGCGKQQVAFIKHFRKQEGDSIFNLMDVRIPGLRSNESREVWCPKLGRGDLGAENLRKTNEWQQLGTKAPVWNESIGSLVLDFKGRNITPSAKNFQLSPESSPDIVACQCGKIGNDEFSVDFQYPLSVIQAFGISLTTIFWM